MKGSLVISDRNYIFKDGGLDLSRLCLDRDSRSRQKKADLNSRENLSLDDQNFKKFKNLNQEKKFGLDCRENLNCQENLNTLKKLVSTLRTFSISILIGLDCRYPQAYKKYIGRKMMLYYKKMFFEFDGSPHMIA
jgi:hypothetical protein